jgi:hypothetical protein
MLRRDRDEGEGGGDGQARRRAANWSEPSRSAGLTRGLIDSQSEDDDDAQITCEASTARVVGWGLYVGVQSSQCTTGSVQHDCTTNLIRSHEIPFALRQLLRSSESQWPRTTPQKIAKENSSREKRRANVTTEQSER